MSEVFSPVVAKQGEYIEPYVFSVLYSDALDVGLMKAQIRSFSDCRQIKIWSEAKAIVQNGFKMEEYLCKKPGSARAAVKFKKIP